MAFTGHLLPRSFLFGHFSTPRHVQERGAFEATSTGPIVVDETAAQITVCLWGSFRPPEETGLSTYRGVLIRDSESFGSRFWDSEGAIGVSFGPYSIPLETESF
jgi:hypothetical protein